MPTRKTPIPEHARCLICGTGLTVPVFDCPECATPHHSSCWQWSGGCAVYGCRRAPRQVREREVEQLAITLAARRPVTDCRRPLLQPLPPVEEPPARGATGAALEWLRGVAVLTMMAISAAGPSRPPAPSRPAHQARASANAWRTLPAPRLSMTGSQDDVRLAESLIKDDSGWEGSGDEPGPKLCRMMVAREGEALRSGVSRLATRPLPDWVRARVHALQRTATAVESPLLASRRP